MEALTSPRITASLVAVDLDGPAMRDTWLDPTTVLVGYDSRVIDEDLVVAILQSVHGGGVVIVEGVSE